MMSVDNDGTGTALGGEDACQQSLNDTVYGKVQRVSSVKFDGTSTWDELRHSINPHIANFDNEFQRDFDDECTTHEITSTM